MKSEMIARSAVRALGAVFVTLVLGACASSVYHSFGFDMRGDKQDADVLEYRYGSASRWIGHTENEFKDGRVYMVESTGVVDMPKPDFLFVKWRNRGSGQVFEDKVDLRERLPRNIKNQTVYFMIHGSQLYVYLVSDQPRPPGVPHNGPRLYEGDLVLTVYPDTASASKKH